MLHPLPVEIIFCIVDIATRECVACDDLFSALQLALVSHDIRARVIPIAYHTLFINSSNCYGLAALANQSTSKYLLRCIRHVVVAKALQDNKQVRLFLETCPDVERIDAHWDVISDLEETTTFRPHHVALLFEDLRSMPYFAASFGYRLTHIEGYHFPSGLNASPSVWVPRFLANLPAVTHIALDVAAIGSSSEVAGGAEYTSADVEELMDVIRAILQHARIQQVVLHMSGVSSDAPHGPEIVRRLTELRDTRIFAWVDARHYLSWEEEEELCAQNTRSGRDVWNSGEQLHKA